MRFRVETLKRIAAGEVTLAFRRWPVSRAKPGGRQRTGVGELHIDDVREVSPSDVTDAEARKAGYASADAMFAVPVFDGDDPLWRIAFTLHEDPRVKLRNSVPSQAETVDILAALDAKASRADFDPFAYLRLIGDHPATRAPDLAAGLGLETKVFKRQVRQLKEMGLTESLKVGYRLSPRGQAVLAARA